MKYIRIFFVGIWNFFFGIPYETQAEKLDLDKIDPLLRGPNSEKSKYTVYRANKVQSSEKK